MDILINYGFTIDEIHIIMDTNIEISKTNLEDLDNHIKTLLSINCTNNELKNIIICNPFFLNIDIINIENTINTLKDIGITDLNQLFDYNPYLLNINSKDIKKIYLNKEKEGVKKEDIIEYFNNTILF